MRRRASARLSAAVFGALLAVAGTAWFGVGSAPSSPELRGPAPESVLALGSGVVWTAAADRAQLGDWARRDKRVPSGLLSVAALVAGSLSCVVIAASQVIAAGAAGRYLRGIARSFAARSPPFLQPV